MCSMNKRFIYVVLVLILAGCNSGQGQDDAGADSGDAGDAAMDGSADADSDGDADADGDSDSDADADADADAGDAAHPSDAGEDAYCPYDAAARVGWVKTWGGPGSDEGTAIAVGPDGTIVVAGTFHDTVDFDPGPGEDLHTATGDWSAFISKFTEDGEHIWTRTMGGDFWAARLTVGGVAVLSDGSVVMGGDSLWVIDFDPGPDEENRGDAGSQNLYVVNLTDQGDFNWVYTAESVSNIGYNLTAGQDDSIYLLAWFQGEMDFDPGPGEEVRTASNSDVAVVKLNPDGSLAWVRNLGGAYDDQGRGIAVGDDGSVLVTGLYESTLYFERGQAEQTALATSKGEGDIFVVKLDPDGNPAWVRTIGGLSIDIGESVCVDEEGSVYVGGMFGDVVDFDPTDAGVDEHTNPPDSVFVTKYTADGGYEWTRTFGSTRSVFFKQVSSISNGIVFAGSFYGEIDMDPGPGVVSRRAEGQDVVDIFEIKFDREGKYIWSVNTGDPGFVSLSKVVEGKDGNLYSTGWFFNTADFDPTSCKDYRTSMGTTSRDVFLWGITGDGSYY